MIGEFGGELGDEFGNSGSDGMFPSIFQAAEMQENFPAGGAFNSRKLLGGLPFRFWFLKGWAALLLDGLIVRGAGLVLHVMRILSR